MSRVAVVLSGCGYLDGAEIHESVVTLLALDRVERGARRVESLAWRVVHVDQDRVEAFSGFAEQIGIHVALNRREARVAHELGG